MFMNYPADTPAAYIGQPFKGRQQCRSIGQNQVISMHRVWIPLRSTNVATSPLNLHLPGSMRSATCPPLKFVAGEITLNNASILYFSVDLITRTAAWILPMCCRRDRLAERDYYFSTDAQSVAIQQAYKIFLATLFELTGSIQQPQSIQQISFMGLTSSLLPHTETMWHCAI